MNQPLLWMPHLIDQSLQLPHMIDQSLLWLPCMNDQSLLWLLHMTGQSLPRMTHVIVPSPVQLPDMFVQCQLPVWSVIFHFFPTTTHGSPVSTSSIAPGYQVPTSATPPCSPVSTSPTTHDSPVTTAGHHSPEYTSASSDRSPNDAFGTAGRGPDFSSTTSHCSPVDISATQSDSPVYTSTRPVTPDNHIDSTPAYSGSPASHGAPSALLPKAPNHSYISDLPVQKLKGKCDDLMSCSNIKNLVGSDSHAISTRGHRHIEFSVSLFSKPLKCKWIKMLMWHTREGSLGSSLGCMLHNKCIATASHLALVYSDWASDKDAGCCWACASLYLQTALHTYYISLSLKRNSWLYILILILTSISTKNQIWCNHFFYTCASYILLTSCLPYITYIVIQ